MWSSTHTHYNCNFFPSLAQCVFVIWGPFLKYFSMTGRHMRWCVKDTNLLSERWRNKERVKSNGIECFHERGLYLSIHFSSHRISRWDTYTHILWIGPGTSTIIMWMRPRNQKNHHIFRLKIHTSLNKILIFSISQQL